MVEPMDRLATSPFSRLVGPIDVRWEPNPVFRAEVADACTNSMGRAHGGYLSALVDITTGQGVKHILADHRTLVTVTTTIEFLHPARVGDQIESRVSVDRDTGTSIEASCHLFVEEHTVAQATVVFSARRR